MQWPNCVRTYSDFSAATSCYRITDSFLTLWRHKHIWLPGPADVKPAARQEDDDVSCSVRGRWRRAGRRRASDDCSDGDVTRVTKMNQLRSALISDGLSSGHSAAAAATWHVDHRHRRDSPQTTTGHAFICRRRVRRTRRWRFRCFSGALPTYICGGKWSLLERRLIPVVDAHYDRSPTASTTVPWSLSVSFPICNRSPQCDGLGQHRADELRTSKRSSSSSACCWPSRQPMTVAAGRSWQTDDGEEEAVASGLLDCSRACRALASCAGVGWRSLTIQ